jgi:hypothetical protein
MKTHSKAELAIMAAQARALALSARDSRSASAFTLIAQRLEEEAEKLADKFSPARRKSRPVHRQARN